MKRRIMGIIGAAIIALLLITTISGLLIYNRYKDAGAEIGFIEVTIDGDTAMISAEMEMTPDVEMDVSNLRMNLESGPVDVSYQRDRIEVEMEEKQFREIIDRDTVAITGDARAPIIGPIKMTTSFEEDINISFISEITESLNVSNVRVNFTLFGTTIVEFDLTANVSRDFQLNITNTQASLVSPGGSFTSNVISLDYRSGDVGKARISIPPISALGLALYYRDIYIECWGIKAAVEIPLFSG